MYKSVQIIQMISKVVYPELSYKIVGCLFEVFNELGPDQREKYYQKALEKEFTEQKIPFRSQYPVDVKYKNERLGYNFFDFLIDGKIILEIKSGSYFHRGNLGQILSYLKLSKLKLGIIANFTRNGVKFERILNID